MAGKSKNLMGRRKKETQIYSGIQEFAQKFCPDGLGSRTYKTNPGGSPECNQLELTHTDITVILFSKL